jgi:membrane fusion protein (multidrug efflux system)
MSKWGTFVGLVLLLAGALGVYYLFQGNQGETPEGPADEITTEVNVHVGKISRASLRGYVTAYGRVALAVGSNDSPPASIGITAPTAGIISEIKCAEGQQVRQADTLFRLDSRIAEVAAKNAEQAVKFAQQNLTRQKQLIQSEGTSQKLLQQAEHELAMAEDQQARAMTELSLLQVKAPISGTIVQVLARPGQAVDMTTTLAELIDPNRLIIESQVPNAEVSLLKPGQKAEVETDTKTNTEIVQTTGELTFIDPAVAPGSDTVLVRASTPSEMGLRPGQFVKVRFVYVEKNDCLVVPEESLVTTTDGRTVIAVVEGNKAVQKAVQTGLREKGLVQIQGQGISEGMQIVTEGAYGLPPETKIRIITE